MKINILILLLIFGSIVACSKVDTPKPRGYFRVFLPEKEYLSIDSFSHASFIYPNYTSTVEQEFSQNADNNWININLNRFNATIHLTYKQIDDNIDELLNQNYKFAYNHTIKADAIKDNIYIDEKNRVFGTIFEIKGNAASPIQFFATDSTKHFLRGSLYFNNIPNKDSLAPIVDFIKPDIFKMVESIKWK